MDSCGFRGADWAIAQGHAPISLQRGPASFAEIFYDARMLYDTVLNVIMNLVSKSTPVLHPLTGEMKEIDEG